jgi:hypothetical protein
MRNNWAITMTSLVLYTSSAVALNPLMGHGGAVLSMIVHLPFGDFGRCIFFLLLLAGLGGT